MFRQKKYVIINLIKLMIKIKMTYIKPSKVLGFTVLTSLVCSPPVCDLTIFGLSFPPPFFPFVFPELQWQSVDEHFITQLTN